MARNYDYHIKNSVVNFRNIWIGETLKVKSSNNVGTFEGLAKDGRVRIKIGGKIYRTQPNNVEIYIPPKEKKSFADTPVLSKVNLEPIKESIDLHISVLHPELENENPGRILDFQISKCKLYIEECIKQRRHSITIIHGIGKGQLKTEVKHLLSLYPEVQFFIDTNNGGAQQVQLVY